MTPPPSAPYRYEARAWRTGLERIAGIDEAGRGPLAGPVVAAAVIIAPDRRIKGLADSKLLPPERAQILRSWRHTGFNVHHGDRVEPDAKADLEKLARSNGKLMHSKYLH